MEQREKQLAETDGRVPHQFEVFGVLLRWHAESDGDLFPRCLELSRSHFSISCQQKMGGGEGKLKKIVWLLVDKTT